MQQWNSMHIDPPDVPDIKAVDFHGKHKDFIPNFFHQLIYPKPADDVLKKMKYYRRNKRNKRLEALNMDKDNACFVVICMEDEDEKYFVDGNNIIKDVVIADDSVDADFYDAEKER